MSREHSSWPCDPADGSPRRAITIRAASLFLLLALSTRPAAVLAESVQLAPIRDNTLFEDAQGTLSNGAGTGIFVGRNSQGRVRRALIAFDLSNVLPAKAVLDSAVLRLQLSNASVPDPREVRVHRGLADWGEGTSVSTGGGGAPATAGDATWLHAFFATALWTTPGGDYDPGASAARSVEDVGTYQWSSAGLSNDVRAWLVHPAENFGWILIGDESAPSTARRFDSREIVPSGTRPTLVLFYSQLTPVSQVRWGGVKARYR